MKLPLWRLISGLAVLGSLVGILLSLAPVYVVNYRFTGRVKATVEASAALNDDAVRNAIMAEAKQMDLPVFFNDIKTARREGKLQVELKYAVRRKLGPYHVDLHFHPAAQTN